MISLSNHTGEGIPKLKTLLTPGKTFCLLGSSGVGKTTLLNTLLGDNRFETRDIRQKDSKGRHTTTRRQLIMLQTGAMIVDTPGMRELGNLGTEAGLEATFEELVELSEKCRYADCSHIQEKGCALLEAVETGSISEKRYGNFIKMAKEREFNEMSYYEKRKKDKNLGKFYRSVLDDKKKFKGS